MAQYWRVLDSGNEIGLALAFTGNKYFISKEGAFHDKAISYSVGTLGPVAKFHLGNGFEFVGSTGFVIFRRLVVWDGRDVLTDDRFKPTLFLKGDLQFVL